MHSCPEFLIYGPGFNPWCCNVRRRFLPSHKCPSPHYCGPCLSITPYLGKNDNEVSHTSIHPSTMFDSTHCAGHQFRFVMSHHYLAIFWGQTIITISLDSDTPFMKNMITLFIWDTCIAVVEWV